MRQRTLKIRFESQASLRAEFEKNISNRGLFAATDDDFEIRQVVDVEIELACAPPGAPPVVLRGEVVHRVTPEMERGGGRAGIAIQFEETVAELKARFEPLLGDEPLPDPDVDQAGERRRNARREPVRVPIRVRVGKREAFDATSRDLSGTGVLLSVRGDRIAVGETVRIGLSHPVDGSSVEIAGSVVREVKNKSGQVAAVAVAFDRDQAAQPRARQVIEALRQASHRGRLGGISGSIVDIGLANLIQMFGSSAPQGTLVVEHGGEQGFIAFADNHLVAAEIGALLGKAAVEEMLGFREGRFEFEARVDPSLLARPQRAPLAAVVLEAVFARDERGRPHPVEGGRADGSAATAIAIAPEAVFQVDVAQEEVARGSLEKTEEAVLDLARAGMSLARIEAIIPEPPQRVRAAIASLVEMGILIPR